MTGKMIMMMMMSMKTMMTMAMILMAMSFIIRPAKVCYGIGDIKCGRGTEDMSDCPCGGQSGPWNQVCSIGFETTKSVL